MYIYIYTVGNFAFVYRQREDQFVSIMAASQQLRQQSIINRGAFHAAPNKLRRALFLLNLPAD